MTETRKPVVAECWTCIASGAWGKGGPVSEVIADVHRAAGHDVRPVEVPDPEPDHSIPYDGCACGDAFCGGCEVRP